MDFNLLANQLMANDGELKKIVPEIPKGSVALSEKCSALATLAKKRFGQGKGENVEEQIKEPALDAPAL